MSKNAVLFWTLPLLTLGILSAALIYANTLPDESQETAEMNFYLAPYQLYAVLQDTAKYPLWALLPTTHEGIIFAKHKVIIPDTLEVRTRTHRGPASLHWLWILEPLSQGRATRLQLHLRKQFHTPLAKLVAHWNPGAPLAERTLQSLRNRTPLGLSPQKSHDK